MSVSGGKEINGDKWIFNTYEQWQKEHFPWWSKRTIERIFEQLHKMLIVESCQPEGRKSRKKYYRLNTGMWLKLLNGSLPFPDGDKLSLSITTSCHDRSRQNGVFPSTEHTVQNTRTESLKKSPLSRRSKYPTEEQFNAFLEKEGLEEISSKRPDLYDYLVGRDWTDTDGNPIDKWRNYVRGLNTTIDDATHTNS